MHQVAVLPSCQVNTEQAEAELSLYPPAVVRMSRGLGVNHPLPAPPANPRLSSPAPGPPARPSSLLNWRRKLKVHIGNPGQAPPDRDIQVMVRPQKGENQLHAGQWHTMLRTSSYKGCSLGGGGHRFLPHPALVPHPHAGRALLCLIHRCPQRSSAPLTPRVRSSAWPCGGE